MFNRLIAYIIPNTHGNPNCSFNNEKKISTGDLLYRSLFHILRCIPIGSVPDKIDALDQGRQICRT